VARPAALGRTRVVRRRVRRWLVRTTERRRAPWRARRSEAPRVTTRSVEPHLVRELLGFVLRLVEHVQLIVHGHSLSCVRARCEAVYMADFSRTQMRCGVRLAGVPHRRTTLRASRSAQRCSTRQSAPPADHTARLALRAAVLVGFRCAPCLRPALRYRRSAGGAPSARDQPVLACGRRTRTRRPSEPAAGRRPGAGEARERRRAVLRRERGRRSESGPASCASVVGGASPGPRAARAWSAERVRAREQYVRFGVDCGSPNTREF